MTDLRKRCIEIADKVVPSFRGQKKSCMSRSAKRWNAAYHAAEIAMTSYVPLTEASHRDQIEPQRGGVDMKP